MKKKIALISDQASPLATIGEIDSGGQNVYVAELAIQLSLLNFQIDIFTRRYNDLLDEIVYLAPGVRVIHMSAGPHTPIPKEDLLPLMDEFYAHMASFIKRENILYHLVHANFWLSGIVAMKLKEDLNLPFVITFHGLGIIRRFHQKEADRFPEVRIAIEKDIVEQADKIIAECPNDTMDLVTYYKADARKIEIIPCGYNPSDFNVLDKEESCLRTGLDPSKRYILQLGRIVPRKGIDNIIQAFAEIQELEEDLRLVIVGGNPEDKFTQKELNRLKDIATRNMITRKVIFVNQQDRGNLKYFYNAAEFFVTTPWYEAFGITPLEAMACGKPVIASDVGGLNFTIRNKYNGYHVPPKAPRELAVRMLELVCDNALRTKMGNNALESVTENFTWSRVAEMTEQVYYEVLHLENDTENSKTFNLIHQSFRNCIDTLRRSRNELSASIYNASVAICTAFNNGNKILICGNGGSAGEAQHFSAELLGRFQNKRRESLPAISLTSDIPFITAWSNEYNFDEIFSRQVEALGNPGDILFCISTTGNSPNILHALKTAKDRNMVCINLTGGNEGAATNSGDINLIIPSQVTCHVQEVQLHLIHTLTALIENELFPATFGEVKLDTAS